MAEKTKILFVDDEAAIRTTLPEILSQFGFDITTAATVPEALHFVMTKKFDVLIADLNIGEPGDGLTVVSAMRRTQPTAVAFILTGYPAIETALEAIRQQVDDYLIKPADIQTMVDKIKGKLTSPRSATHRIQTRPLTELLGQNKPQIVQRWLQLAKQDPQLMAPRLSDQELTAHLPSLIAEAVRAARGGRLSRDGVNAAADHGRTRFRQGCTLASLMRESRILHQVLTRFIQENLLAADISSVIGEVMQIGEVIHAYFERSVQEHIHARHAVNAAAPNPGRSLLLLNADRELALLRDHALRQAGYTVTRADSRKEALRSLKQPFDALVISYPMASKNLTEMSELFRKRNPNSPIITVTKSKWQRVKLDSDHAISGEEGPAAMIEAVEAALNRKQLRRIK